MTILKQISDAVKGKTPSTTIKRSSEWIKVRKQYLEKHPACEACGEIKKLEVHHIKPFHLHPELELDENNLITLCETASNGIVCHMNIGHNGDYKSYNINVKEDAKYMLDRIINRPYNKKLDSEADNG